MEDSHDSKQPSDSSRRIPSKYKEDNPQAPDKTEAKPAKKRLRHLDRLKRTKNKVPASNLKKKKKLRLDSELSNKNK